MKAPWLVGWAWRGVGGVFCMYAGPLKDKINFPGMFFKKDDKVKAFHAACLGGLLRRQTGTKPAAAPSAEALSLRCKICTAQRKKFTAQPSCLLPKKNQEKPPGLVHSQARAPPAGRPSRHTRGVLGRGGAESCALKKINK